MKKLSIIIVTYKSENNIYDCLASVWQYCDLPREALEVIVVDNSPESEPMFTRLRELYGSDVTLIHNTHNGGYGQGNNVGIRRATAPVIMIMNPDVRLMEPVFKTAVEAFENDQRLVLCGFTQRLADGSMGRSTSWVNTVHPYIAEPLRLATGKLNLFWSRYMFVTGACFFLRKESFVKAGLFDEQIFMYGEEEDIHNRLMNIKGARMKYLRHFSYLHLHPEVSDFSKESHAWMEQHLHSLCHINRKRGIPDTKTIGWAIKRNNLSVWKETLKSLLLGGRNKDRLEYYCKWHHILQQKLEKAEA